MAPSCDLFGSLLLVFELLAVETGMERGRRRDRDQDECGDGNGSSRKDQRQEWAEKGEETEPVNCPGLQERKTSRKGFTGMNRKSLNVINQIMITVITNVYLTYILRAELR